MWEAVKAWLIWWWALALSEYVSGIPSKAIDFVTNDVWGKVSQVLNWAWFHVPNVLHSPVIWAAAPFASSLFALYKTWTTIRDKWYYEWLSQWAMWYGWLWLLTWAVWAAPVLWVWLWAWWLKKLYKEVLTPWAKAMKDSLAWFTKWKWKVKA